MHATSVHWTKVKYFSLVTLSTIIFSLSSRALSADDPVAWLASHLLSGRDIYDYEIAINKFARFSDPIVLPTLLKLLDHPDKNPRAESAGVLWRYNTKDVRDRLVELTKDYEPDIRVEAAKSLSLMGHNSSFGIIEQALKSRDVLTRVRALQALAEIKSDSSKTALNSFRSHQSPIDQIWAAYAGHSLGIAPNKQLNKLKDYLQSIPAAAKLSNKKNPTIEDLERAARLGKPKRERRIQAAIALSKIGSDRALELLATATGDLALAQMTDSPRRLIRRHGEKSVRALIWGLKHTSPLVRLGCAISAGKLHLRSRTQKELLAQALAARLNDNAKHVRLEVLNTIAALGMTSANPQVAEALKSSDPKTRINAAKALGVIGNSDTVNVLIDHIKHENNSHVRRSIYQSLAEIGSTETFSPLFKHLKVLYRESLQKSQFAREIPYCIKAVASAGDVAAEKALKIIPNVEGPRRDLMIEVLALSKSELGIDFFIERLRESPPDPESPAVKYFLNLDSSFSNRLEYLIQNESAMWIRVILATALFQMGKHEYSRGILWGLDNDDRYLRKLTAAISTNLNLPSSINPLIEILSDEPDTAQYAARALLSTRSPNAIKGLLEALNKPSFRHRRSIPVKAFWEGKRSAAHPYSKEVDNERVWVVYADDRFGRKMDLFVTWSADGQTWNPPLFTGLTSFADPEGNVPPPTFSLKVRGRDITIALTRTFAQSASYSKPRFKTLQRVHRFRLQDLFVDKDNDGLKDLEEKAFGTFPRRSDSDGDGTPDGTDKNPLSRPANLNKRDNILKILAFSHIFLIQELIPSDSKLLLVSSPPNERKPPELTTFPWLVLHLTPQQILTLWKSTGAGFPMVRFGATTISHQGKRATQTIHIVRGIDDKETTTVHFLKKDDVWTIVDTND
jgi:HEAT repeat protein